MPAPKRLGCLISTHTSRVGCDRSDCITEPEPSYFYSHIPCGMWPAQRSIENLVDHFYSHIPCGMWLITRKTEYPLTIISTHTSRVGCDGIFFVTSYYLCISTHTSRVGCDANGLSATMNADGFLLTHPVWDVTRCSCIGCIGKAFLLTHPVWDVTPSVASVGTEKKFLLTHPVWDVTELISPCAMFWIFLLTHPVWDVTIALSWLSAGD